jgi:alanine or glycine:cation symporter, AGCS family
VNNQSDGKLFRPILFLLAIILMLIPAYVWAGDASADSMTPIDIFRNGIEALSRFLEMVLFYDIMGLPFLLIWLVGAGIYFTLRLGFVNIRMFGHGFNVARGKYSNKDCEGDVSPFAALSTAVAGTVGLGNIAGVAVAISLGGPGAVIWMMVAGLLGMSTIFAEVLLGQKYREKDSNGKITGGAFMYLSKGLAEQNRAWLGKALAVLFSILCIGGALGGGNMLQSNQLTATLISSFPSLTDWAMVISAISAAAVGVVLIGGVKRIGHVAEAVVPFMAIVYFLCGFIIIGANYQLIPHAVTHMFEMAFTPGAAYGGILGVMIQGFRRAAFSNEAGVGSTPIVFAATRTQHPVSVASMAVIAPFVDTMLVCFMTGLMIVITGVYEGTEETGVVLTGMAFATVADWFPIVLSLCVTLFAFSTMLTWSYYAERAWGYLFGYKKLFIFHIIFCALVFFGGSLQDKANDAFSTIVSLSDLLLLSMAFPNLIGVYFLQKVIVRELKDYRAKLKSGEIAPLS